MQCKVTCQEYNTIGTTMFKEAVFFLNGDCYCLKSTSRIESACENAAYPPCTRTECFPTVNLCSMPHSFILNYTLPNETFTVKTVTNAVKPFYISGEPTTFTITCKCTRIFLHETSGADSSYSLTL